MDYKRKYGWFEEKNHRFFQKIRVKYWMIMMTLLYIVFLIEKVFFQFIAQNEHMRILNISYKP
jgi:hypothetical protein